MIIADTGFFLALFNANDDHHQRAITLLQKLDEPLITTHPVVTETINGTVVWTGGIQQKCQFLLDIAEAAFQLFEMRSPHFQRMAELIEQYQDLPMDYADASLVVLAEYLNEGRILTTDCKDFAVYRWHRTKAFNNLLFP